MTRNAGDEFAAALLQVGELLTTVLQATEGYRKQCEERGFSPTAAEQMALAYHDLLVRRLAR